MSSLLQRINFGNEAGDDIDFADLKRYFFEQEAFRPFTDSSQKIAVATAKKGVGKSALLRWTDGRLAQLHEEDIVIRCRGADLARSRFAIQGNSSSIPNERIREWMIRICALINRELAQSIGLAISDDSITLVESAELDGFKERNLVGSLLDRLSRLIPTGSPKKQKIREEVEILKRRKTGRVWLLIDDLDATFQNSTEELLELSTFFSAMRYLSQDVEGVRFRATMRTDVWPLIRRYDESLDKIEQYVNEIEWTRDDFKSILYKRILSQLQELKFNPPNNLTSDQKQSESSYINMVIEPQMEWAQKNVSNYQVLYTLAYQRPRWGIQLCKLAQKQALRDGEHVICKRHIDGIWAEYGTKRIADLVAEHKHQCKVVEELILCFRGAPRLMSRDTLFDWINRRVMQHVNVQVDGAMTTTSAGVARFLYRIGFIIARSEGKDGYHHYTFNQMPDFLTTRTNNDFGVEWEIHPCYREALEIEKVERSHRARSGRLGNDGRNRR